MRRRLFLFWFSVLLSTSPAFSKDANGQDVCPLPIEEFIAAAVKNDTVFEEILIDELDLKYSKALELPAGDLVLSVRGEYDLNLTQDTDDHEAAISLSKLFPYTGTTISAEYGTSPSPGSDTEKTSLSSRACFLPSTRCSRRRSPGSRDETTP